MENLTREEKYFYNAMYAIPSEYTYEALWKQMSLDRKVLNDAIGVSYDSKTKTFKLNGPIIANSILINYANVPKEIYEELVNTIYTHPDIARIVIDGFSNDNWSFLLMTLINHNLVLNDNQKAFAVREAIDKVTTQSKDNEELSPKAHGKGYFDIRYFILRNPNWSREEKERLIKSFYPDIHEYSKALERWKLAILIGYLNKNGITSKEEIELAKLSCDEIISSIYENKDTSDDIRKEIEFCNMMSELTPSDLTLSLKNS